MGTLELESILLSVFTRAFFFAFVLRLAIAEWDVLVFDHMLYLSFHGDCEEDEEIHDKNGPEDGHVQGVEKRADHGDRHCFSGTVPKFKLG